MNWLNVENDFIHNMIHRETQNIWWSDGARNTRCIISPFTCGIDSFHLDDRLHEESSKVSSDVCNNLFSTGEYGFRTKKNGLQHIWKQFNDLGKRSPQLRSSMSLRFKIQGHIILHAVLAANLLLCLYECRVSCLLSKIRI